MLIDIHTQSQATSDGYPTIQQLVAEGKKNGLDGICLTDANCITNVEEARKTGKENNFLVLVGFEAYTNRGHFIGLVPEPEKLPDYSSWLGLSLGEIVKFEKLSSAVKQAGGILIAACPFDRSSDSSPCDSLVNLPGISAIEVICANLPALANDMAEELAAGVGLPGVGGTNIVNGSAEEMGKAATLVRGPVENEKDLIDRILAYDVWPVSIGKKPLIGGTDNNKKRPPKSARNKSFAKDGKRRPRRSDSRKSSRSSGGSKRSSRKPKN